MRDFEARFLPPLGILAITAIAFVTYWIEGSDSITAVDSDFMGREWEVTLAAGQQTDPLRSKCLSFYVPNMDYGAVSMFIWDKQKDEWREINHRNLDQRHNYEQFMLRAKREVLVKGRYSGSTCGSHMPFYDSSQYGNHINAGLEKQTKKVWRNVPLFVRFASYPQRIRCIHHNKSSDTKQINLKDKRFTGTSDTLMFYTHSPSVQTVTVWGTTEPCGSTQPVSRGPVRTETLGVVKKPQQQFTMSRRDRLEAQRRLTLAGYDTNGIDGVFGKGTKAAISGWQKSHRWPTTGVLTQEQFNRLKRDTASAYAKYLESKTVKQPVTKKLVTGERPAYKGLVKEDR